MATGDTDNFRVTDRPADGRLAVTGGAAPRDDTGDDTARRSVVEGRERKFDTHARRDLDEAGVRTRPPRPVGPSAWVLPDPHHADEDGVVGMGADLAPTTLVDAYRRGIFPWPHPGIALPWFSPDPRGIIELDRIHISRSLRRRLRTCGWTTTVDAAFRAVIAGCAHERGPEGTWIDTAMIRAYERLHMLGWAHSLEVWDGDLLIGGIYGVQVGGVFTGESMFRRVDDASKVALVDLVTRLRDAGADLLDVQLTTPHLESLGAVDVDRAQFLARLAASSDRDVRMTAQRLPVDRPAVIAG